MRFKPNRPIYINEANTGKSAAEVILAVEQLRSLAWLCVAGEGSAIHLSFDDLKQLAEFKKDAAKCGIEFRSAVYHVDDFPVIEPAIDVGDDTPSYDDIKLDPIVVTTEKKKGKAK